MHRVRLAKIREFEELPMQHVASVAEMRAADSEALKFCNERTLIERAGRAVACEAISMLKGAYGKRITVIAGKGSNGEDGRLAASYLRQRGAVVTVFEASTAPSELGLSDLIIDAAYGTGFHGDYSSPSNKFEVPVLAVDIPSGVDGDTGSSSSSVLVASSTVTFAALKPGLLQGDGAQLAGLVKVADIGVDLTLAKIGLVEDKDVTRLLPRREFSSHKWSSPLMVIAGSRGMQGAGTLCASAALRSGAGMVRFGSIGQSSSPTVGQEYLESCRELWPIEPVRVDLGCPEWSKIALNEIERCAALVIGPGIGRSEETMAETRKLIAQCPVPVVADADALFALGDVLSARKIIQAQERVVVLTPHDEEYKRLLGQSPGADRIQAARNLAKLTGAMVLLKGNLTVVATPWSESLDVLLVNSGTPRLATAGTGDVLSGAIGALIARGVEPLWATSLAAHIHGRASSLGRLEGLIASDLPRLMSKWMSELLANGKQDPGVLAVAR